MVYGGVERSIQAPMVVQKGYHLRCSDKTGPEGPHQKDSLSEPRATIGHYRSLLTYDSIPANPNDDLAR